MAETTTIRKFIDKIFWNKTTVGNNNVDEIHEYDIAIDADKVFINRAENFTVARFFSWVQDFFTNGAFFVFQKEEPQSLQTSVWLDTNPYCEIIKAEDTIIDDDTQIIDATAVIGVPFAVERDSAHPNVPITITDGTGSEIIFATSIENNKDIIIIYGKLNGRNNYIKSNSYTITYDTTQQ